MSTEALTLDQAVDAFLAPEGNEPASNEFGDVSVDDMIESDEDTTEETTEVDSEVEDSPSDESDDYDEEDYDTNEESAENDDEPDHLEPEKYTVKVDGEEVSVTLEDLKRSFSGQGKIQKGMQEAAEARKQAEAMREQVNAMAQQLTQMYQRAQQKGIPTPPTEPSRELFNSDPLGYMEAKMDYDAKMKEYQTSMQEMAQVQQYQQQQMTMQQQQRLAEEMRVLQEKIPEFGDAEKAAKLRDNLVRTGIENYGFTQEELSTITDHRALMVLRDAMRYRQSQSKRSQVEQKTKDARPVIKPQAKKKPQSAQRKQKQQQVSKFKKTGRIDDALSLMFE